jgi:hypothetical protein
VLVLHIAKLYDSDDEYVVYQNTHTSAIGVIKLVDWNEVVEMDTYQQPRFC